MAQLKIDLIVNDDGTATLKNFAGQGTESLNKLKTAGADLDTGFAKTWAGIAAGAAGAIFAFQQLAQYARAPIEAYMEQEKASMKMGMALKNQGDYSREALRDMEAYAEMIQRTTTVGDDAALSVMANLKSYGMTNEEVKRATKVALDFAAAKESEGMSITTASELLGKAYAGNTAALGRYGIVLKEGISEGEKFDAVMAQLQGRFGGSAQAALQTYAGQWASLKNQWGDIQEMLGIGMLKTLEALGFGFSMVSVAFYTTLEGIMKGFAWIFEKAGSLAGILGFEKVANSAKEASKYLSGVAGDYGAIKEEALKMADTNYTAMMSTDNVAKAIEGMGAQGKRTYRELTDEAGKKAKAEAKLAEEIKGEWRKIYLDMAKYEEEQDREREKYLAEYAGETAKTAEAVHNEWLKIYASQSKWEEDQDKQRADALQKFAQQAAQKATYERDVYSDLRGYAEDYYASSIALIQSQAQKYREAGVDEVAIAAWVAQETEKAELKKLKASNDWRDGVKAAYIEMQRSAITWSDVSYATVQAFTQNAQKQLSDIFFNFLTGRFDQMKWDWNSLWDALARTMADKLAQMAVQAATVATVDWVVSLFAAQGIWDVQGSQNGIPAIVHPGEMIVPAQVAELIRQSVGESGYSDSFAGLQGAFSDPDMGRGMAGFAAGMAGSYGRTAAIGTSMALTGQISLNSLVEGLLSPQAFGMAALTGGIPGAMTGILGLDPSARAGYSAGLIGTMATIGSLPGAIAIGLLGMLAVEGVMDALDARYNEQFKDALEDVYGWFQGHLTYAEIAALTKEISPGYVEEQLGFYGYTTFSNIAELATDYTGVTAEGVGDLSGYEGASAGGYGETAGMGGAGEDTSGVTAGMGGAGESGSYGGGDSDSGGTDSAGGDVGGEGASAGDSSGGSDSDSGWYRGGLKRRAGWVAERGPEWIVPTREPERSGFLRNIGADPDTLGAAIAKRMGGGRGVTIQGPLVVIEGNLIGNEDSFNELVERIDDRLAKLQAWGH